MKSQEKNNLLNTLLEIEKSEKEAIKEPNRKITIIHVPVHQYKELVRFYIAMNGISN